MNWKEISIKTFIAELPKYINENFKITSDYIDSFYDNEKDVITKPLFTTGRVKGTTGEFLNLIVDNLTIRNHDTSTAVPEIDPKNLEYVQVYNGNDETPRDFNPLNTWEVRIISDVKWIDAPLTRTYYKINNVNPIAINAEAIGQEIYIMYDRMIAEGNKYQIIMDPNDPNYNIPRVLEFEPLYGPISWHKLVCVDKNDTFGSVWAVKEWSGAFGNSVINLLN